MAAIGSPTTPCYFDANGVAKQCTRDMKNLAYCAARGITIVIGPDGSDDNIETQCAEIINGIALHLRTPLYSINGAVRLAARFSISEQDSIYIQCQNGTYTWNETQRIRGGRYFQIRPLELPTTRPAISTRPVKFVFNATAAGATTCLEINHAQVHLSCIALKNNTGAGAAINAVFGQVTISGCVIEGACDGIDGECYVCNLRSYLIGENRTYSATEVDTSTAIETYIFGQSIHGIECDMYSVVSLIGWVRIKHTGTNGYAIILPRFGHLLADPAHAQRIDIKVENQPYAIKSGYYNYITCGNTTWRCNLDEDKLSTLPVNDTSRPLVGYFSYADTCTYTKVTNPLA